MYLQVNPSNVNYVKKQHNHYRKCLEFYAENRDRVTEAGRKFARITDGLVDSIVEGREMYRNFPKVSVHVNNSWYFRFHSNREARNTFEDKFSCSVADQGIKELTQQLASLHKAISLYQNFPSIKYFDFEEALKPFYEAYLEDVFKVLAYLDVKLEEMQAYILEQHSKPVGSICIYLFME